MAKTELTSHCLAAPNLLIPGTKSTSTAEVLFASKREFINSQETLQTEVALPSCTPILLETKNELTLLNQSQLSRQLSKPGTKKFHPSQPITCQVISSTNLADEIKDALLFLDRCRNATEHEAQETILIELSENAELLSNVRNCVGNPSRNEGVVQSDATYLFGLPGTTAASRVKSAKQSSNPAENTQDAAAEPCTTPEAKEQPATSHPSVSDHQEPPAPNPPHETSLPPSTPIEEGTEHPESPSAPTLQLVAVVQRVYSALQNAEHLDAEESRVLGRINGVLTQDGNFYNQASEMVTFFQTHKSKIIQASLVPTNE